MSDANSIDTSVSLVTGNDPYYFQDQAAMGPFYARVGASAVTNLYYSKNPLTFAADTYKAAMNAHQQMLNVRK